LKQVDKNEMAIIVFDKCAVEYQEKYMDVDLYKQTLNLFCDSIKKKEPHILELACGPGNITQYLLQQKPQFKIVGIDLAPNMVKLARLNNASAEFKVMDCRGISVIDEKFDGIMCGFCLPYLSKEEAVKLIADASQLLKKEGVIYLSTMEGSYSESGLQKSSSGKYELYMYFHEDGYLLNALSENGFKIINIQHQDYPASDKTKVVDLIIIARKMK
jgi:ubiquinone/menaquinone biosynthesis C-methylase UbiE